jgi:hypothetical protein
MRPRPGVSFSILDLTPSLGGGCIRKVRGPDKILAVRKLQRSCPASSTELERAAVAAVSVASSTLPDAAWHGSSPREQR